MGYDQPSRELGSAETAMGRAERDKDRFDRNGLGRSASCFQDIAIA
jgi:hypothetical protein